MVDTQAERIFEMAKRHHQAGRLQEAGPLYQQYLALQPNHPDALHLLGFLMYSSGRPEEGLDLIRRATALEPERADFFCNLGVVYAHLHQHEEAMEAYQQALRLKENFPQVWFNIGVSLTNKKKLDAAIDAYKKAIELLPTYAEASLNLGSALKDLGRNEEAAEAFRQAIQSRPNFAEPNYALGHVLLLMDDLDRAIASLRRALALRPEYPEACLNLAHALRRRGNWQEATAAYRRVLAMDPKNIDAHIQLAHSLRARGEMDEALEIYRKAQVISPNTPEIYHNIGMTLEAKGNLDEAFAAYQQAIKLRPEYVESLNNLGNIMKDTARVREALAFYDRALAFRPAEAITQSNRLYALHLLPELDPETIFHEHLVWDTRNAKSLVVENIPYDNDRSTGRRLRIGYVSCDFREHSVAFFLENLLTHHQAHLVETFCYSDVSSIDATTGRLRKASHQWRSIVGLSDAKVAEMVRQDKIDILVDLAGHTGGNRLLVFARKPAPIQVSYLGYPDTTGLSSIDYKLVDHFTDPLGKTEAFYSERLMRIPNSFLCYRPPENAPDVNELPAASTGKITFGSFNNLAKVSEYSIEMWAEILKQLPNSRLLIKSRGLSDASPREYLLERFASWGIAPEQLDLRGRTPTLAHHLEQYHDVDIALDTFPYNGTTTTCEALWMGVPVITLAGITHVQRVGVSLLSNLQMPELIAYDGPAYVQKAVDLANDLESLKEIRRELREWMRNSPLTDGKLFATNIEHAYRKLWLRWTSPLPV